MRLIEGPTLKNLILDGVLTPGRTLRLLAQVAEALEEAHRAGLIHRDIKPQNILVGPDDHAYLADFGLIKSLDDADPLTRTGQFIGTIDYVAPEQVQGDPASPASDSYALAAVLFECLTGRVPFVRQNEVATIHAHVMAPPPLVSELRPDLPRELDEVIAVGMAKVPERRPSSPTELMRAAARAFASQPGQLDPVVDPARAVPQPTDGALSQPTRVSRRPPISRSPRSPAPPG
jgi:serine/threonine-protein kinase